MMTEARGPWGMANHNEIGRTTDLSQRHTEYCRLKMMAPSVTPTPTVRRSFTRFQYDAPVAVEEEVIGEIRFTVFLDGKELVTFMCSPWKLRELVLGFLYLEGLIESLDDVTLLRICPEDRMAEVRL